LERYTFFFFFFLLTLFFSLNVSVPNAEKDGGVESSSRKKLSDDMVSRKNELEIYSICIFNLLGPLLSVRYFCYTLLIPILDGLRLAYVNECMKAEKQEKREKSQLPKRKIENVCSVCLNFYCFLLF
jgi:hypothetical protein